VPSARHDALPPGGEREAGDAVLVPLQDLELRARRGIPQTDRLIGAARRDASARGVVRIEDHRLDGPGVPREDTLLGGVAQVADDDRAVRARRRDPVAVRAHGQATDGALVHRLVLSARRGEVPDTDAAIPGVPAAGREEARSWREAERVDAARAGGESAQRRA